MPFWGSLKGKKTYITAGITILGAVAGYLTGDVSGTQVFQLITTAVMAATVRHGVENS